MLKHELPWIVVANGPAGTGKTHAATAIGLEKIFDKQFDRMVITRPIVPADENIGYLPGDIDAKMGPWLHPIFDSLKKTLGSGSDSLIDTLMDRGIVEIAPLAFMRGRTLERAWIVCDEAQNCTRNQMLMLMTRIGEGSKMVVTGDLMQHDRHEEGLLGGGLHHVVQRLRESPEYHSRIGLVEFEDVDIVRHPVIPHVLELF
jgi:phosphate starvation-inducible PhoH-like protein